MAVKQVKVGKSREPVIFNRRARHDYQVLETMSAGISLLGPEVKSVRAGNASLAESFGRLDKGEVFLYNMYVAPYKYSRLESDPRRPRKLLLNKREIAKLDQALSQKGLSLVPLKLHFRRGWAKMELAIAKGKREFDKREAIRRREAEQEMRRRR